MHKITRTVLSFLLVLSMIFLSSCSFFKDFSPGGIDPGTVKNQKSFDSLVITKNPNQYTFLYLIEGASSGSLASVMMVKFDVDANTLKILQIPTDTYIRANGSIEKYYNTVYTDAKNDGSSTAHAIELAVASLKTVIQNHLMMKVDYFIHVTKQGFAKMVDTVGGVDVKLPFVISFPDGTRAGQDKSKLTGAQAANLYTYGGYSAEFRAQYHIHKILTSAILGALKSGVDSTILSLCALEIRECITTDIPSSGGADVYLLKKLTETAMNDVSFTIIRTQSYSDGGGDSSVMVKQATLNIINEFFDMYSVKIADEEFDSSKLFYLSSDKLMTELYNSSGLAFIVYTAAEVISGKITIS